MPTRALYTAVLFLASCSSAPDAGAPSASSSPTADVSGRSSVAAATTGAFDASDGNVDDGPLASGDYSSDSTGATITFSLADDIWQGATDIPRWASHC